MMIHKLKRIQSKLLTIGTYDVYKISLFCFDDKRYMLRDGINSLAYFHKDIRSQQNRVKPMRLIKLIKSSKINNVSEIKSIQ